MTVRYITFDDDPSEHFWINNFLCFYRYTLFARVCAADGSKPSKGNRGNLQFYGVICPLIPVLTPGRLGRQLTYTGNLPITFLPQVD